MIRPGRLAWLVVVVGIALASPMLAAGGVAAAEPGLPHDDVLDGVSCAAPVSCVAVGAVEGSATRLTLAESWSGSSWRVQATPNPRGLASSLVAVSCPSRTACTAVGAGYNRSGFASDLVEQSDHGRWRLARSPDPFGSRFSGLYGVSCWQAGHCMVVGYFAAKSGLSLPLAEVWNGARFRPLKLPSPRSTASGYPLGVACRTADNCMAVGSVTLRSGANVAAADAWNGSRWRALPVPPPASARTSGLNDVSCPTAVTCYAVGNDFPDGQASSFAEAWRAGKWRPMKVPALAGTTDQRLVGIDCPAASRCTATGFALNARGNDAAVVETLRGGTWHVRAAPQPAGTDPAALSGVSCARLTSCVAVGNYDSTAGILTLAEVWNGSDWRILTTSSP